MRASSAFVLSAVLLAAPAAARAEAEDAKKAVISAISKAADNSKQLASVPVEFAAVVMIFPYGDEFDPAKKNVKNEADAAQLVAEKAVYWELIEKAVSLDALRAQRDVNNAKPEEMPAKVREAAQVGRLARAAAAIAADAKKDWDYVKTKKETNQQILSRKKDLLETLKAFRD